jgi:hypothetical protein
MVPESLLGLFEARIEGHIDILVLASDLDGAYPTGKTGYDFSVVTAQILSRRIDIYYCRQSISGRIGRDIFRGCHRGFSTPFLEA